MTRLGPDVPGTANYRQIEVALCRLRTFRGNSMSARWERDGEGRRVYTVYSYRTPIARHTPETGETWTDEAPYSRTTRRHQGLVRRNLPGAAPLVHSCRKAEAARESLDVALWDAEVSA